MFKSILRPLSCSVDKQFFSVLTLNFWRVLVLIDSTLRAFIFTTVFKFKKKASIFSKFYYQEMKRKP